MQILLIIAWRNIWKNKRRTIITTFSVFMAVFFALFTRSMQIGTYNMMINGVTAEVGDIQVHDSGYWESKSINDSFIYKESIKKKIEGHKKVEVIIPRFETFVLGSYKNWTKGIMLQGIIPELEEPQKKITNKLINGRFLEQNDHGIVLAEGLAKYFNIMVNDTIVLLGQGYQGVSAAGLFPVIGIIKYPIPKLNNVIAYMNLNTVQKLFAPYHKDLVSTLIVHLKDNYNLNIITNEIKHLLSSEYEVMQWEKMLPETVQLIESDNIGGLLILGILYIIVAFGIFGTIFMMTMERKKEFAIMVSVGLHRSKLALILFIETIIIGLMGVLTGILLSFPFLRYLFHNPIPIKGEMADVMLEYNMEPIIPFSLNSFIFTNQGIIILALTFLIALYPVLFAYLFKILKAMRT